MLFPAPIQRWTAVPKPPPDRSRHWQAAADSTPILTCSFGKDSIATALLALQHGEPLDELVYSEVMFSDTVSGELPEHKRFIYETAIPYFEKRGIPTRVLRGQKTYLDCFYHIVSRGNAEGKLASFPLTGRCSIQRDCKLPPIRTYQKTLPQDTVYYLGIAADEPIRLARLKENQTSLSTCEHSQENGRLLVVAKRRNGEKL